jgi:hypothetical protein
VGGEAEFVDEEVARHVLVGNVVAVYADTGDHDGSFIAAMVISVMDNIHAG